MPISVTRLVLLVLLVFVVAIPAASAAPGRVADDAPTEEITASEDSGEPDAEPEDDELEDDGIGEVCSDDDAISRSVVDEDVSADEDEPDALDDVGEEDFLAACEDEGEAELTPTRGTLASLLKRGSFDGGHVTVKRAATIEQTLRLTSGKDRKGKPVLGKTVRKIGKSGSVRMTVKLTKAGRAALKKARGTVRVALVTIVKSKGRAARTTTTITALTR